MNRFGLSLIHMSVESNQSTDKLNRVYTEPNRLDVKMNQTAAEPNCRTAELSRTDNETNPINSDLYCMTADLNHICALSSSSKISHDLP